MNIAQWSVTCSNMSQRHTSVWGKWNLRWEKASLKLNRTKTRPIFARASAMNAATKKLKVKQERSDLGYRTPSAVVPSSPNEWTAIKSLVRAKSYKICCLLFARSKGSIRNECCFNQVSLCHELEVLYAVWVLPPLLPLVGVARRDADVADRRVEPHVKHLHTYANMTA